MPQAVRTALLTSVAWACLGAGAQAQDRAVEDFEEDTIVVRGVRSSVEDSLSAKRRSDQLVDVIAAEDIGKLPDENVAEALQRVTGVQITRQFGEGQDISIRGLPQVRVEVDGRTLLGFSVKVSPPENQTLGRSSGLDIVPSGVFSRLEVRKSPTAKQIEGGLGGSVNLVTPKPFDFRERTIGYSVEGVYSEGVAEVEPAASGFYADTFFDDRIGILLAADYSGRTSTTELFERNNFLNTGLIDADGDGAVDDIRDGNGDGLADIAPDRVRYEYLVTDRERYGFSGELQFAATEEIEFFVEGLYSHLETGRNADGLEYRFAGNIEPTEYLGNFIVAGNTSARISQFRQERLEPTDSWLVAAGGSYEGERWSFSGEASYSKGTLEQEIRLPDLRSIDPVDGFVDFTAGDVPTLELADDFDVTDASNYFLNRIVANLVPPELDEIAVRGDVGYEVAAGHLRSIEAGLRYRELGSSLTARRSFFTGLDLADIADDLVIFDEDLLDDSGAEIPLPFLIALVSSDEDYGIPKPLDPLTQRDYDIEETSTAAYLQANFEGELGTLPYRANVGVRYVTTDFEALTFTQVATDTGTEFIPAEDSNDYDNWLPSANITINLRDDLLLRGSAAKVMQRASIADLAPSLFVNPFNFTATGGNAQLEPTVATQFDTSLEWYFAPAGIISIAAFYKDVEDFVAPTTEVQTFVGFENLGPLPFTRPENVSSGEIKGFEVSYQQAFDFLPVPFNGLGVITNYTFSDAELDDGQPVVGNSENSYNLIGYYEAGPFQTRLAYNYRDEAVFSFTQGRPDFIDEIGNLDFQASYDVNDKITLSFQAINLLPEQSAVVEYSADSPTLLNSYALSERRYFFGIRGRL